MKKWAQHWFRRHAVLWAQQSLRERAAWKARAQRSAVAKFEAIRDEQDELSSELEALSKMCESEPSVPLAMSAAALTDAQLLSFARLMEDPAFRKIGVVQMLRDTSPRARSHGTGLTCASCPSTKAGSAMSLSSQTG